SAAATAGVNPPIPTANAACTVMILRLMFPPSSVGQPGFELQFSGYTNICNAEMAWENLLLPESGSPKKL
ncbi:hypothetical protein, partial [Corynebacterium casei]|uniref:hypothetical protein n=1 Tax=Corynebacterium casei TaxID=160386 RepID=UPI003F9609CE